MTILSRDSRGRDVVQVLRCLVSAEGGLAAAHRFAQEHYGGASAPERILRGAVDVGSLEVGGWGSSLGQDSRAEFLELLRPLTITGRLQGLRRAPLTLRMISQIGSSTIDWIPEGGAIPCGKVSLTTSTLDRRKVGGIIVLTNELVRAADPDAEQLVRTDLTAAAAQFLDAQFIDPAVAAVGALSPASVTFGSPEVVSGGDPVGDMRQLVATFPGDLSRAILVSDPVTFAEMNLYRDAGGNAPFADVGARGGAVGGIPALSSAGSPRTSDGGVISLLDPGRIVYGEEGPILDVSSEAIVEMANPPQSSPPDSAVLLSLWQENLVGIKLTQYCNWLAVDGAAAYVSGADYGSP